MSISPYQETMISIGETMIPRTATKIRIENVDGQVKIQHNGGEVESVETVHKDTWKFFKIEANDEVFIVIEAKEFAENLYVAILSQAEYKAFVPRRYLDEVLKAEQEYRNTINLHTRAGEQMGVAGTISFFQGGAEALRKAGEEMQRAGKKMEQAAKCLQNQQEKIVMIFLSRAQEFLKAEMQRQPEQTHNGFYGSSTTSVTSDPEESKSPSPNSHNPHPANKSNTKPMFSRNDDEDSHRSERRSSRRRRSRSYSRSRSRSQSKNPTSRRGSSRSRSRERRRDRKNARSRSNSPQFRQRRSSSSSSRRSRVSPFAGRMFDAFDATLAPAMKSLDTVSDVSGCIRDSAVAGAHSGEVGAKAGIAGAEAGLGGTTANMKAFETTTTSTLNQKDNLAFLSRMWDGRPQE